MVRIHVQQGPERQFLYECSATARVGDVAKALVQTHNLQLTIRRLILQARRQLRPDSDHPDAGGASTGNSCKTDSGAGLERAISEAEAYISKEQVLHGKLASPLLLKDHIQNIEREIANYSFEALEHTSFQPGTCEDEGLEFLHEDETRIWWAGKELQKTKALSEYVGKNEKTKIVVKLEPSSPEPSLCSSVSTFFVFSGAFSKRWLLIHSWDCVTREKQRKKQTCSSSHLC
ncbi:uncharacterized protein LOC116255491 isoform X3 [Nymphaea colorata]|uniref:uncharacterized protein LOC116255491 isoform X3 n=1 Tax=Nymphaea colorata TaxID=210225 RepID=UPI00129D2C89|nr:uncharacterized protein LOC116255491 isoform X3 [Nymphaea colorata]